MIKYFKEGKILSLISDAGTPLLSDPGKILVNYCIQNKIKLIPISANNVAPEVINIFVFIYFDSPLKSNFLDQYKLNRV